MSATARATSELFCLAHQLGTNFLVRSCVDRLARDGDTTIAQVMADVEPSGTHLVRFRDAAGHPQETHLSVKFATMTVRPPIGKQKRYEHQQLRIIHAAEIDPPDHRAPLLWKLITNLEVISFEEAVHKLEWYARRWSIETFFKTLKTGCRIEDIRLTTADRLANRIALACVTALRIFWLTMLGRADPEGMPSIVFTETERALLDRTAPARQPETRRDLKTYITAVARLGGYLARRHDAAPGTTVLWRGFARLADLVIGYKAALRPDDNTCG
jgi:Transposase Tn5 dimerisation domain